MRKLAVHCALRTVCSKDPPKDRRGVPLSKAPEKFPIGKKVPSQRTDARVGKFWVKRLSVGVGGGGVWFRTKDEKIETKDKKDETKRHLVEMLKMRPVS